MLKFDDLLALEGVDTDRVRLVRNQNGRLGRGRLAEAWRHDRKAFESYLSVQSKDRFPVGDLLAEFVVTEAQKTAFVGLYRVDAVGRCPDESVDALLRHDTTGHHRYDLTRLGERPGERLLT